jgi:3-oxosteroid 1-dehydrogenase
MSSPSGPLPDSSATPPDVPVPDVIVIGSGAAALSAALAAAVGGASVLILEKSEKVGGTSAMSGGGTWIPVNHHARAAGLADSAEEVLNYLRAASAPGWAECEEPLWRSFVEHAPEMLQFVERHTPLRFALVEEPDPQAELPGGKVRGRMLSPRPLSRRLIGAYAGKLRRSTLPHRFTYQEMVGADPYASPIRAAFRFWPRLLSRIITDSAGQGNALMVGLLKGVLDRGCRLELEARVVELVVDPASGRVEGVEVERQGRRERLLARRGVVLATGGFEWDAELFRRNFPGPLGMIGSPPTNTGDGQKMAARIGAAIERMDQANIFPLLPTTYEGRPHGIPVTYQAHPHAIVVDRNGRRFVSEYDYNFGEALDRRDPATGEPLHLPCWLIADARYLRAPLMFHWYARKQKGWVRKAPTLEALAAAIEVPGDALKATVERFNGFARAGRDLDFHRGESIWERYKAHAHADAHADVGNAALGTLSRAPFVAVPLNRSTVGTKGGARTNERGQVVRPDGSIIAGLYCAGNAMANPIGTRAVGAGTTIGPCLTWGFICGTTLLRENR